MELCVDELPLDAPVDVTQVDHIVFGDQIIPVPQTAE